MQNKPYGNDGSARSVLILQARMGSTRLPGKSMMPLAGEPLVGRILERVCRCKAVDDIILAIPDTEEDRVLMGLADRYGVRTFAGSEDDLVDRYFQASKASKADIILRLPADNIAPQAEEIDRIVTFHRENDAVFSSNLAEVLDSGYPDGIGAEAFDFAALEEVWSDETDPYRREHVHLNFFDYSTQTMANPERYPVIAPGCPSAFRRPDIVLDVNTAEDYAYMSRMYDDLYPANPEFSILDIVKWYDENPRERFS